MSHINLPIYPVGILQNEVDWDDLHETDDQLLRVQEKDKEILFYVARDYRKRFKQGQVWAGFVAGDIQKILKPRKIANDWGCLEKQRMTKQELNELISMAIEKRSTRGKSSITKPMSLPPPVPLPDHLDGYTWVTYVDPEVGIVQFEEETWNGSIKLKVQGKVQDIDLYLEGDLLTPFTPYQIASFHKLQQSFEKIEKKVIKQIADFCWSKWAIFDKNIKRGRKGDPTDEELYSKFKLEMINIPIHSLRRNKRLVTLAFTPTENYKYDIRLNPKFILLDEHPTYCVIND